jgi:hypothetical protein
VISGSSGSADGIRIARPRSPGVIEMFPALIYASIRWRDGIIDAKTRLQPAQQKTKYLWRRRGCSRLNAVLEWDPKSGYIVAVMSNFGPPSAQRVARQIRSWLPRKGTA